jgi:hypothetical protein
VYCSADARRNRHSPLERCTAGGANLARNVAAVINQREDPYEQAYGGHEQEQNPVAQGCASLRAGSSRALVAHGAALRVNLGDGQRDQSRATSQQQRRANQDIFLHFVPLRFFPS